MASRLTNVSRIKNRGDVKTKEYGNQPYRSSLDFASQMRVATEKAKTYVNPNLPESEMVRPYASESYEEMEYNLVPEAGGTVLPTVEFAEVGLKFDVEWDSPTVANIAFEESWEEAGPTITVDTFTGIFYSGANGDDGYCTDSTFRGSGSTIIFGGDGTPLFVTWMRFLEVAVPQGAEIISAKMLLRADASDSSSCVVLITCNNEGNAIATAPTSKAEWTALAKTSGTIFTIPAWVNGTWYETVDFSKEVQAVVNNANWTSEFALMVMTTYSSGVDRRQCDDYESGSLPQLQLTWKITTEELE